jgi:NAD(P)-dependent dehydrogenase (short-subunit alcohol dehydrogenase family)
MLEEQKAVVIGGTSGIGLAAAIELCRAGAQVWVTGRTPDKAIKLAGDINAALMSCQYWTSNAKHHARGKIHRT